MPKLYWLDTHVEALKRLADLASSYNKAGVLNSKKDWEEGLRKLAVQDTKNYKVISNLLREVGKPIKPFSVATKRYLASAWHSHQMRAYGLCKTKNCLNKVLPNSSLCEECAKTRTKVYNYGHTYYTKERMAANRELINAHVDDIPDRELKEIVKEDIDIFPIKTKKKILGTILED